MNPLKYAFGASARKFLGFLVHHGGIRMDLGKTIAIATMKMPTTVKELKSFLGRVFYIKRFILGLASVTNGLSKLLKRELSSHEELSSKMPSRNSNKPWTIYLPYKHQYMGSLFCFIYHPASGQLEHY